MHANWKIKWGYSNDMTVCECSELQNMEHLLICRLLGETYMKDDFTAATERDIVCVQFWKKHLVYDKDERSRSSIGKEALHLICLYKVEGGAGG